MVFSSFWMPLVAFKIIKYIINNLKIDNIMVVNVLLLKYLKLWLFMSDHQ